MYQYKINSTVGLPVTGEQQKTGDKKGKDRARASKRQGKGRDRPRKGKSKRGHHL